MSDLESQLVKFPFSAPSDLEHYLPYLIARLAHRWRLNQDESLVPHDLKGANMRLLSCLSAFGELTIGELAVLSVTEQSSASRAVEQLVIAGLVERSISKLDQRVRTVSLSKKGIRKLAEIAPVVNPLYSSFTKGIDGNDLETCIDVLQKILAQTRKNEI